MIINCLFSEELGRHYFEQKGINIDKQFHFVVQDPSLSRARRIAEDLLKLYHANELDELYIIYTTMVNAMQEEATGCTAPAAEKSRL